MSVTIDGIEYEEDQLTDAAKACINHINSLDQKIASAQFNVTQMQVGREAFMAKLKAELPEAEAE